MVACIVCLGSLHSTQFLLRDHVFFHIAPINDDIDDFIQADFYKVDFITAVVVFYCFSSLYLTAFIYLCPLLTLFRPPPAYTHTFIINVVAQKYCCQRKLITLMIKIKQIPFLYHCRKQLVQAATADNHFFFLLLRITMQYDFVQSMLCIILNQSIIM